MKRLTLILGLLVALVLSACAAPASPGQNTSAGQNASTTRTISVNGSGQVTLNPDIAKVFIGVQSQSQNVADALTENNDKAQAIASSLREMGIEEKDIQTSSFNVYPQQQYSPTGEMTGTTYVVNNTVNVTVRDLQLLGRLLEVVVSNGANSIDGVTFDVQDKSQAVAEARRLAVESARSQADELAKTAGVTLGDLQSMSAYSSQPSVMTYEGKGGMAAVGSQVPVSAGQLLIQVDVSATYLIQ